MADNPLDLFKTMEPLHPDLAAAMDTIPNIGTCIKHPLVYSVPHVAMMNAFVNRQYEQKRKAVECARQDGDWNRYIFMHERAYRFPALGEIQSEMPAHDFWKAFRWVWIDTENLWQNYTIIIPMLRSGRPGREEIMDEEERAVLAAQSEELIVYRGHKRNNRVGFTWTLDRDKAIWFANRFGTHGAILTTGVLRRENVIALLLGRSESEIICFRDDVTQRTETLLP